MPGSTTHIHEQPGIGRLSRKLFLLSAASVVVGTAAGTAGAVTKPNPGHVIEKKAPHLIRPMPGHVIERGRNYI
jgi:hypothetical protein